MGISALSKYVLNVHEGLKKQKIFFSLDANLLQFLSIHNNSETVIDRKVLLWCFMLPIYSFSRDLSYDVLVGN